MNKFEIGDNPKKDAKDEENLKEGSAFVPGFGLRWLIGVDEVGRGPLAGPVTVSAVAIPYLGSVEDSHEAIRAALLNIAGGREYPIGVDSKKMKESDREFWHGHIASLADSGALIASVLHASACDIDMKGIAVCIRELVDENLRKILHKIQAQDSVHPVPAEIETHLLLDGALNASMPVTSKKVIIKGDEKEIVISLASVFAKVTRDRHMKELSKNPKYLPYGFDVHKGYGTAKHGAVMRERGLSDEHRKSFCKNYTSQR